jgi:hypothetical protein
MAYLTRKLIKQNKKVALHIQIETHCLEKTLIGVINYNLHK